MPKPNININEGNRFFRRKVLDYLEYLEFGPMSALAEAEIFRAYGDTVSVSDTAKSITKFGRYEDLNATAQTVQSLGGSETYVATNAIDSIVSSSGSDTETIQIQGHTIAGGVFTEVTQTKVLTGTTPATLDTPLARVQRIRNNGSTSLVGAVKVYDLDGADYIQIPAGSNQSFKASMTVADGEYLLITNFMCSVTKRTSAVVDYEIQVRDVGSVFRPQLRMSLGSGSQNTDQIALNPYLIVKPNSDIRVVAVSSATATSVDASFQGIYAAIS